MKVPDTFGPYGPPEAQTRECDECGDDYLGAHVCVWDDMPPEPPAGPFG